MPVAPAPRRTPPPADAVVARLNGTARESSYNDEVGEPMTLTMRYSSDQPYAVQITITRRYPTPGDRRDSADWVVSRELLYSVAMWRTPAGLGDFRVAPMAGGMTRLMFVATEPDCDGGGLYVDVKRIDLKTFLLRTAQLVEPGHESEHVDVDVLIAACLGGENR